MIPDDVIDEVRARADIVDIIGEMVPLKKAGKEFKARCPFHEERTPSFYVVPDKGFYKCFGCGKSGGAGPESSELEPSRERTSDALTSSVPARESAASTMFLSSRTLPG